MLNVSRNYLSASLVSSGHFPPPTTPEELGARILIQERYEKYGESEDVEMEVESEDEDDERVDRNEGQSSQPDQDTQVQDMDEVWADDVIHHVSCKLSILTGLISYWYYQFVVLFCFCLFFPPNIIFTTYACRHSAWKEIA